MSDAWPYEHMSQAEAALYDEDPLEWAVLVVGARGFEPLTSSASRKRSPPELSARADLHFSHTDPSYTALTAHNLRADNRGFGRPS
jgi:hypothetical protein